jgi:hypothetical protein
MRFKYNNGTNNDNIDVPKIVEAILLINDVIK